MPPRRKRGRLSDSDEDLSSTQPQEKGISNLSHEEISHLTNDLVHYILVCDQKKFPLKQLDMKKQVFKENGGAFKHVFKLAKEKLEKVFSANLNEVPGKSGQYVLINRLTDEDSEMSIHEWSDEEKSKCGLLFIILSTIFMNGGVLADEQLRSMLKKFGVNMDNHHEVFGDVKKLINHEYKQQLYLEISKVTTTEPPTFEYKWGSRAIMELTKKEVLDFVCTLYPETSPESWIQQHREAGESNDHA